MANDSQHQDSKSKLIRVLHVDDEVRVLEITRLYLQNKGYNCFKITPVLSAEQAMEILEEENFDVIVADYKMPGMSGLEFLEVLRKKGNDIPFIILTGKGAENVAMEALNKGACRYITKKVGNPNVLFDTLGQYILEVVQERKEEKEREEIIKEAEARGKEHPLILALKDNDWNVRMCAAEALGKIGDTRAIDPLIHTLKEEEEDVRESAAEALGKIGSTKAIDPLIQTLKDKKGNVRESAAEALGKIGEPAVEPLIHAMDDEEENVRLGAAWALGELRDGRAVEPLISALIDENLDIQWSVTEALIKIGDERAVEPLIHALKDEEESVRWCAVEALGELRDGRAVEPLIHALKDIKGDVRKSAAEALGKIEDKKAVEPLISAFTDRKEDVRLCATEALAKIGEPAIEPLISALRDRDTNIQKGSAGALGELRDKRAVEPLIQASKVENEDVRKAAENALDKIQRSKEELHEEESESDLAKKKMMARNMALEHLRLQKTGTTHPDLQKTTHLEKEVRREEVEVKLSPKQIMDIRDLHSRGYRDSDIAKRMGIPRKSVTKHLVDERVRKLEEAYTQSRRIRT